MRRKLMIGVLSLVYGVAFAAPSNPLLRPAEKSSGGSDGAPSAVMAPKSSGTGAKSLPPPPPPPKSSSASSGAPAQGVETPQFTASPISVILGKYSVVAISGDMAVLRQVPTANGAAKAEGGAPAGAIGAGGGAQGGGAVSALSMIIQNKKPLFIQDQEVLPEVVNNQVTIRNSEKTAVLFYGRLEGGNQEKAAPKLENENKEYVTRNSPMPAAPTTTSTASAPGQGK